MISAYIDRYEGELAVLLLGESMKKVNFPREFLPDGVGEILRRCFCSVVIRVIIDYHGFSARLHDNPIRVILAILFTPHCAENDDNCKQEVHQN